MINRTAPEVSPKTAFTELDLWLLDELVDNKADEDRLPEHRGIDFQN